MRNDRDAEVGEDGSYLSGYRFDRPEVESLLPVPFSLGDRSDLSGGDREPSVDSDRSAIEDLLVGHSETSFRAISPSVFGHHFRAVSETCWIERSLRWIPRRP